jgi:hypothetical protein
MTNICRTYKTTQMGTLERPSCCYQALRACINCRWRSASVHLAWFESRGCDSYLFTLSFYMSELRSWCCWNSLIMNLIQKWITGPATQKACVQAWNRHMYIQEVVIVRLFLPISIPLMSLYNFKASRTCCQGGQSASYPTATMSCSTQPRWFPLTITPCYSGNRCEACWFRISVVKFTL